MQKFKCEIVTVGHPVERTYSASKADVAIKKFLNYLRRFKKDDRPTVVRAIDETGKQTIFHVEWYIGKLEKSSFAGPEGEFYKLLNT